MSQAVGQADHELPEVNQRGPRNTWTFPDIEGLVVYEDFIAVRPDVDPDAEPPTLTGRDEHGREVHNVGGRTLIVARDPKEADEEPEPTVTGVVIGVGPGKLIVNPLLAVSGEVLDPQTGEPRPREPFTYEPMPVEVGQHITHSKYGIAEVEVAGETLRMMRRDALRIGLPTAPDDIRVPEEDA